MRELAPGCGCGPNEELPPAGVGLVPARTGYRRNSVARRGGGRTAVALLLGCGLAAGCGGGEPAHPWLAIPETQPHQIIESAGPDGGQLVLAIPGESTPQQALDLGELILSQAPAEAIVNARRLTNVGTFRAYIINYLRSHPGIHQNMTFLVRQLQPTPEGLPIEIYVFTNDVRWAVYEGIQADVFDHILAIAPEFGLQIYQRPSGHDLEHVMRDVA